MHILYAVTTCSDAAYGKLFGNVKVKPAFQSQKYHRLLIEGLAKNAEVDVIANPPVNRTVCRRRLSLCPTRPRGERPITTSLFSGVPF